MAIGILLGLLANSLAKGTQRKYRQLVEEIDLRGFSDPLLIRCEKSKSTRKLVEIIAEERNMTRQYSETLERHVLSHQ